MNEDEWGAIKKFKQPRINENGRRETVLVAGSFYYNYKYIFMY